MKQSKWMAFVVVALSSAVALILLELLLRSSGLGYPILFYANASYRYAPQPNQSQVRQRGAKVTIDSKGFRAVKDWTSPADGKLLFIGDSITWGGTYIDDEDTFAAGVCARLEQATGRSFVCGNAGANEYGTDNMAERIRYKTVDDETAVIVTLFSGDTVRGLRGEDAAYIHTVPPLGPFKALWEVMGYSIWRLNQIMRPIQHGGPNDIDRVVERSLQNLFAAIRETQRAGRQVLIVFSPVAVELNGHEIQMTLLARRILEQSGLDVLDLHAAVSAAYTPDFYYDGVHLDRRGHRFYADQIAQRLLPGITGKKPLP